MKNTKTQKKKDPYAKERKYLAEREKASEEKYGRYEPIPEQGISNFINKKEYRYIKRLLLSAK